MIKKTILMLLVLVGGVMSANAWNSAVLHYDRHWDSDDVYFTKISDVEFYIQLDGSVINNGLFYFRFAVKGDGGSDVLVEKEPDNNDQDQEVSKDAVTSNYNAWTGESHQKKAWYISQDENADKVDIYIKWANDTWNITAVALYKQTIIWDNSKKNWSIVKAYSYDDDLKDHRKIEYLGKWNDVQELSGDGNKFSVTIYGTSGVKAIFHNGSGEQTQNLNVINNGVYDNTTSTDPSKISVSIKNVGYATFCCTKALDFLNETTIEACKASVSAGKITYTPVTTVAADEGVLLRRKDGTLAAATAIIPLNNDQTISPASDNAFKAITTRQKLAQTTDGNTNYILTIVDETLGFYKVNANGSWCAAGTAYLSVPSQLAPDFIALDGETTGIANVSRETISNNQYYTLDGRRVAQPTKGLYIVNGKKVIIK